MADMSVHEFVSKIFDDKAFLQEVVNNCWDVEAKGDDAFGATLGVAARRMGYDFSDAEIDAEAKSQIKKRGGFKAVKFLWSFGKAQKKAKKAAGKK